MNASRGSALAAFDVPRDPRCAARARNFVRAELGTEIDEEALERVLLTVSELVTNAWKHGEGRIEVRFDRDGEKARIEVIDEGSGNVPEIRKQPLDSYAGWGLRIVDALSVEWGCFEGATHVWAEVPLGFVSPAIAIAP